MKNVPTNLSNLKSKEDKLDVDKLVPVPVELSKLSDGVKNDVAKKDVYDAKIKNIEDKVPGITKLATNTTLNAKINEIKNEIPSITELATTPTLTSVENEIPNFTDLVKKQNMVLKYQKWKMNILLLLIIIRSLVIHLMQR